MARGDAFLKNNAALSMICAAALMFSGCENFFGGDDLRQMIEEEVATSTAPTVELTVRPDPDVSGGTTSLSVTTQKLNIDFPITATTFSGYAFTGWTELGGNDAVRFADQTAASTTASVVKEAAGIIIQANFDKRPSIENTDPGPNEKNVLKNKKILINFSEVMDPDSITFDNIQITSKVYASSDAPVSIIDFFESPVASEGNLLFTINLKDGSLLSENHVVTIRVSKSVRDAEGILMADDYSWYFRIGTNSDLEPPYWDTNPFSITRADGSALFANSSTDARDLILKPRALDADDMVQYLNIVESDGSHTETTQVNYQSEIAYELLTPGDGPKTITVTAQDPSGNVSAEQALVVNYDTTPPTVTLSNDQASGFARDADTVRLTATFSEANFINESPGPRISVGTLVDEPMTKSTNLVWYYDWNVPAGNDGAHVISVSASDAVGLATSSVAGTTSLSIDNTDPVITVGTITTSGNAGWVRNGQTVTVPFSVAETGSGLAATPTVTIAGQAATVSGSFPDYSATYTFTGVVAAEGAVSYSMSATDVAGNSASAAAATGITYDRTAPTVAISAPSGGPVNSGGSVGYTITYNEAGTYSLVGTEVQLNATGTATGSIAVTNGTTGTATVTISSATGNGTLGITILAGAMHDGAGNANAQSAASATFVVDNTAPTVAISAPSGGPVNSGGSVGYTITYNEAGTYSLVDTEVQLNATGTATGSIAVTNGTTGTATVTISSATGNGTLGITILAGAMHDGAGNANAQSAASAIFVVDNTDPVITVGTITTNGNAGWVRNGQTVTVPFSVAETGSGLAATPTVTIAGQAATVSGSFPDYSATYTFTGVVAAEGAVSYSMSATDVAGNSASAAAATGITYDRTAPTFDAGATQVFDNATSAFTLTMVPDASDFVAIEYLPVSHADDWDDPLDIAEATSYDASGTPTLTGVTTITLADGEEFFYRVVDGAGNPSASRRAFNSGGTITASLRAKPGQAPRKDPGASTTPPTKAPLPVKVRIAVAKKVRIEAPPTVPESRPLSRVESVAPRPVSPALRKSSSIRTLSAVKRPVRKELDSKRPESKHLEHEETGKRDSAITREMAEPRNPEPLMSEAPRPATVVSAPPVSATAPIAPPETPPSVPVPEREHRPQEPALPPGSSTQARPARRNDAD